MSTQQNIEYTTETKPKLLKKDESNSFDLIIIGAGIAGMTCALYAARAGLKILLLESKIPGGQITTSELVENFPTQESISGMDIGLKLSKQIEKFGIKPVWAIVNKVSLLDKTFVVTCDNKQIYTGKTVVIATGSDPKKLDVPGEAEYIGRGVSYCATCDGAFYKNKEVVVVGGGSAAIKEALFLTKFAKKVTVIHRRDQLRAEKVIAEKAFANPAIEVVWNAEVKEIRGEGNTLTGVKVVNNKTNKESIVFCDGVFIYVGTKPNIETVKDLLKLTETGHIAAGEDTKTSISGLFAAGDVRPKVLRQLVTAAADGATAAFMAEQYLEEIHS
jgi:thioredoxin reductase (NADPH)